MPILLFLVNYWKIFAVGGAILAGVLWYNKQLSNSYDLGYNTAVAMINARTIKQGEQERQLVQEESKELIQEQGKQKEIVKVVTKEVIKYVESLPPPQTNNNCRNVVLDADFVRLWNHAANSTAPEPKDTVSGKPANQVP